MNLDLEFYKKILEASHDEICASDDKGIIIYCNKAFEENYGLKKEDILGKNVSFLEESGYSTKSPIPVVLRTKSKFSLEQDTQTGKKLIITASPVFDENGELEFTVENCRDITELNNIKNKLEDTKKQVKKYKSEVETLYRTALRIEDTVIMDGVVMRPIMNTVNHVSKTDVSVLLLGESGTGKSSLARYIHHNSNRASGPFITINCATISPQLLESELFGYTSGAFTGASTKGKVGLVELANGGTLFLDEIGDIPQNLQAKFLQLIQDRTFTPVGSLKNKKVDIRIISATNADLISKVKEKKFREDLYYRLNVIEIKLPPLRERKDNLVEIIKYYFNRYSSDFNLNKTISKEAINIIANYRFPGNIRELQNIIQKILLTCRDNHITTDDLPNILTKNVNTVNSGNNFPTYTTDVDNSLPIDYKNKNFNTLIMEYEKNVILDAYEKLGSSYKVARLLEISQSKANRLIRKYTNT
ncbi:MULTISPECIES: sigma-54 interaction domain-containing protein [unclassified Clostridioides]|uniref:sigma-54 interaction domain-containing protein n=1 Tax=unclassified Clostridioides TaxID=2635829 RepID=UPI001D119B4D|nr:sigma 54-interacting transcriptional regulator [Clostridioides sp. ZZV14-6150]MCC0718443.1 sigma 54-interacting transcriptional regulator [Clostridioides sp. ZZV14-6105]MCC0723022.1 sigma 54-interacting transcriptional regulator [Clostridioides sp. ZZV14-6104]MCC0725792.1 sigma 54-interacting transcriptional regulator [Clostridioides sp. ZZV14-6045]MCC0733884.1 sigma 54-interacting transcriptional regulator [Clostridioides sp. ZZV14-6009]MCC0737786.1 sigma 54-interacting transcriptional reg